MSQLTFLSAEPRARISASQAFEKALLEIEAISHSSFCASLNAFAPSGWFGRTSPASCQATKDGHLAPSSEGWRNSGMGSPTGFLTLNTTTWHSDASVCLLSDVLEVGPHLQRYYLTPKACAGILRRAEKRGKTLPELLRAALLAVGAVPGPEQMKPPQGNCKR